MPVQRPTDWWSIPGWWDELGHPLRRWVRRRFGIHLCVCLVIGHSWFPSGYPREMLCRRTCCRGLYQYGARWVDGVGRYHRGLAPRPPLSDAELARRRAVHDATIALIRGDRRD